ncbi:MAG: hypothetical protein ISS92_03565 [Candidatus Omnitrophica bacterium]|nr:hypothetical protein [Candidatus Omnitrophota bacterium]
MIYLIVKGEKIMDILDNLYIVSVKNKHFLPHAVLFVIGMIAKRTIREHEKEVVKYLGDNIPLNLLDRIKNV